MLGAVPKMIDSIINETLRGRPELEIIEADQTNADTNYDVLVLSSLEHEADDSGLHSPSPSSGIVILAADGENATVFHKPIQIADLNDKGLVALEEAIMLAAGQT